jgi:exosortase A-associated hydrolase 1
MPDPADGYHASFRRGPLVNFEERALSFPCHDSWLYGVLSLPGRPISRGVLIVVGGPQYRVGSHRQFTLLARQLAEQGVPVMRFDYRGMGDSEGDARNFEDVENDIQHAINQFYEELPDIKEVIIWGLCDAASAAMFYAHRDARVTGLVLLNPWIRTDGGAAKAYLKHYYARRLLERELWSKIAGGRFDYRAAARSVFKLAGTALRGRKASAPTGDVTPVGQSGNRLPLPERMLDGIDQFKGKVLLIMSGNDLTAQEFSDVVNSSRKWKKLLESPRVQRRDLPEANHTFSTREWRDQVARWTKEWAMSW